MHMTLRRSLRVCQCTFISPVINRQKLVQQHVKDELNVYRLARHLALQNLLDRRDRRVTGTVRFKQLVGIVDTLQQRAS